MGKQFQAGFKEHFKNEIAMYTLRKKVNGVKTFVNKVGSRKLRMFSAIVPCYTIFHLLKNPKTIRNATLHHIHL